jgi:acyl carrier protein
VQTPSGAKVLESTGFRRWEAVLAGLRADALDCLQSTVAAIADEAYGPGCHLALGCRWRFPVPDADGRVGVQPSVAERLTQARDELGFEVGPALGPVDSAGLRELAGTAPVYVVAEAYDLHWLPYARATVRYREMPHSFLLERNGGGYTLVDAYYADTQWGRARPAVWQLSAAEFDEAMAGPGTGFRVSAGALPPSADRDQVLAANALVAKAAGPRIDSYAETTLASLSRPGGIERLVLDIWHLCRERLLYAVWLGDHPAAADARQAVEAWQQLAGQSYLASRRALRGAAPNAALVTDTARQLHADAALMISMAGSATEPVVDPAAISQAVLDEIAQVLRIDRSGVLPDVPLRALPGYDSFRLVEIVFRIENLLGLTFPDDAPAADLVDPAGLCRLFARSAGVPRR